MKTRSNLYLAIAAYALLGGFLGTNALAGPLENAEAAFGAGDYQQALRLLRPLLSEENADAQFLYARMVENGQGVEKNVEEALKYYRLAAAQDLRKAKKHVQRLEAQQESDTGGSVALQWYLPAAKEGDTEAQYNLAYMYETGWGVPVDEAEAAKWYRKAADMQHDQAQMRLGLMRMTGAGVPKDVASGKQRIRAAAENGNPIAEVLVQDVFEAPAEWKLDEVAVATEVRQVLDEGVDKVRSRVVARLDQARLALRSSPPKTKAPSRPVPEPKIASVEPPPAPAPTRATPKAALQENRKRLAVANDFDELDRLRDKALSGASDAQFQLALRYLQGKGVPRDRFEAMHWLRRAADQGHETAGSYLELLEIGLGPQGGDSTVALEWLKEKALQGDADAFFQLGYIFETGRGVTPDPMAAMKWYTIASKQGNDEATARLARLEARSGLGALKGGSRGSEDSSFLWALLGILGFIGMTALAIIVPKRVIKISSLRVPMRLPTREPLASRIDDDDLNFVKDLWSKPVATPSPAPVTETLKPEAPKVSRPQPEVAQPAPAFAPAPQPPSAKPDIEWREPARPQPATAARPSPQTEPVKAPEPPEAPRIEASGAMGTNASKLSSEAFLPAKSDEIAANRVGKEHRAFQRISADQLNGDFIGLSGQPAKKAPEAADEKSSLRPAADVQPQAPQATPQASERLQTAPQPAAPVPLEDEEWAEPDEREEGGNLADVQFGIGVMFAKGDGVPKNDLLAAKWFRKAAEQGHLEAQFRLGQMHALGRGVKKNSAEALVWLRKAAEGGFRPAQELLERQKRRAI